MTIIAASIPILRVLIREVKTSARRYYATRDNTAPQRSGGRSQNNTVIISSGMPPSQKLDDQSDKSHPKRGPAVGCHHADQRDCGGVPEV